MKFHKHMRDMRDLLRFKAYFQFNVTGVKPLIHQSELGTYTKVAPFQEKSSFHFVVL